MFILLNPVSYNLAFLLFPGWKVHAGIFFPWSIIIIWPGFYNILTSRINYRQVPRNELTEGISVNTGCIGNTGFQYHIYRNAGWNVIHSFWESSDDSVTGGVCTSCSSMKRHSGIRCSWSGRGPHCITDRVGSFLCQIVVFCLWRNIMDDARLQFPSCITVWSSFSSHSFCDHRKELRLLPSKKELQVIIPKCILWLSPPWSLESRRNTNGKRRSMVFQVLDTGYI